MGCVPGRGPSKDFPNKIVTMDKAFRTQDKLKAHDAKVFLITCMDFRLLDDINITMRNLGYDKNYDQYIIAGSSLGFVQQKFEYWGKACMDHLTIGIGLHHLRKIIFIDHMDCGAYKKFYPEISTSEKEFELHGENLQSAHDLLKKKFPKFDFKGFIMELSGNVSEVIVDTEKVKYNAFHNSDEHMKFLEG